MIEMNSKFSDAFALNDEFDTQVYPFEVMNCCYHGYFSKGCVEAIDPKEIDCIHNNCGIILKEDAYQFKFDRNENFETEELYRKPEHPELTPTGIKLLGLSIVKCFELHYAVTECQQYYSLAIDKKLARFYTRLANSPLIKEKGFVVYSGVDSSKLAYLIMRKEQ